MAKSKSEKAYQHFEKFVRRLLAVPKSELKEKETEYKKQQAKAKRNG